MLEDILFLIILWIFTGPVLGTFIFAAIAIGVRLSQKH